MDKKNIVIIFIDAFRTKNLSLFGYPKETDKNLKKIAKENIWFKNHFSVSNSTAPALTSVLTGKYPNNHGIIHQLPYTKPEEMEKIEQTSFWLPTFLKANGYETIAIDWISLWFTKGFDYYGEGEKKSAKTFNSAHDITELALSKITQANKPFFLFLHYWDTHFPFPNTEYKSAGNEKDIEKTLEAIKNESQKEYLKKRISNPGLELYTIQDVINKYDLSIENVDKEIGRIYDFLKEKNLWENTIFIVLGDHGEILTEHGIYFSSTGLYDESVHVPLIMHLPNFEPQEINELIENIDITSTILDCLKLEPEEKLDGISLLPLIKNKQPIKDKVFLFDGLCEDIIGVRTKSRKLIMAKNNFCNLCKASHHEKFEEYDLEKDPGETKNIFSGSSELLKFIS